MAWIVQVSLYIYIWSIWPQMVVEHDRRSIWRRPLRAQTEFMRKNGSSSRSLGRKWEDMILPGHENPRNCVDPDGMKMRWCLSTPGSPKYVLPVALSTSVTPVSPYTRRRLVTIYLEAVIERVERCTWRPRSSELRDALGGRDQANTEMLLEARIEWTQRYTPRPWSSKFGDAPGDRDWVNSEMHLEAVIERVWRCTGRPWSSEFGDALWGCDRARLEMQLETEIEWTQRCTGRLRSSEIGGVLGSGQFGGRRDGSWDSGWERETGWERDTVDLGMMLYLMYAVLGVKFWSWHGEIEREDLTSCS